ncbi:MAG: hypothetical protein A2821_04160 [Candidatus Magasanikbacteria bacterium RIFCSPHIGHO2_01_FULL_41_23]|nr:MAG: hypothetical protein A2821_04160 [Candidatus Magasanikbacteria bacterium RIFCSPHIGHO2_01_FULL_41_23]OGH67125.1 MAG: hypothetical protein A3C66_02475 [Candidatus Magasanikbacteria bacterium RIFCSPHIGHO2_02_FULL_41_35]OGH76713.1 MAG: hypothetical protein A3F22_03335 [Candidatus Magasanikbacteria bacterium RIFCSPHIGHO2_12_FULL_41_16]
MARPKSDLLSWEGSWHEIAKAIANAVLTQGGTDEDVRAILKNKQLATDIAKLLIAARPGAVETASYSVTVSDRTLAEMIEAGHYDWVNSDIMFEESVKYFV